MTPPTPTIERRPGIWERLWDWIEARSTGTKVALALGAMVVTMVVAVSALNMITSASGPVSPAERYYEEYGGDYPTYAAIFDSTDCDELKAFHEETAEAVDSLQPGSDEHLEATGYLTAAEVVLTGSGCRD